MHAQSMNLSVNLFRLFYGILADKLISPRSNFVISFILETLKTGNATTRFIFQFMPTNTVRRVSSLDCNFSANAYRACFMVCFKQPQMGFPLRYVYSF